MDVWTEADAEKCINDYAALNKYQKKHLCDFLNKKFPPSVYYRHMSWRRKALVNAEEAKNILATADQRYPRLFKSREIPGAAADLAGYAIVLTAGGDGVRLRSSLRDQGVGDETLHDFIKATYQIPGLPKEFGSLHANLSVISYLCAQAGFQVPVVITTGPEGSVTSRVIPEEVAKHNAFGLSFVRTLCQGERLHLTVDEKIVYIIIDGLPWPVTHPDETGGPFVKLRKEGFSGTESAIDWLKGLGCTKIIALQATALFDPAIILSMAAAGKHADCLGVGILRSSFDKKDPFGTFIALEKQGRESVVIIEQAIRNEATMSLKDLSERHYLPYNTGLYVFDIDCIRVNSLPDYVTPPKEILPSLPKSPKAGYAATDLMALAKHPAVLAIEPDSYENIKTAADLEKLSALARRYGIIDICEKM
jgi:hypothetical protein